MNPHSFPSSVDRVFFNDLRKMRKFFKDSGEIQEQKIKYFIRLFAKFDVYPTPKWINSRAPRELREEIFKVATTVLAYVHQTGEDRFVKGDVTHDAIFRFVDALTWYCDVIGSD